MIPKLRRKFISITAAALFAVILLVITAINCVFILQTIRLLDSRLNRIMDTHYPEKSPAEDDAPRNPEPIPPYPESMLPDSSSQDTILPDSAPPGSSVPGGTGNINERLFPENHPGSGTDTFHAFDVKLHIRFDGCLIFLDADGTVREIRQDAAEHYDEEELQLIAADIYQKGKGTGWMQYFKYRMITQTSSDGTPEIKLGLINASSDLYSIFTMLLISVAIGILSFLLVLLIIFFASGIAVKPIEESYLRQKQFVTDAGHELKTPLTVISADNELSKLIYGSSEWFDSIDSQVEKMNHLIRSLITLARMDEEEAPVLTPFNLSDAVYDTAKSFEHLIHASGKSITFDIAEDIIYSGDESKLRQVVSILMDNAAKYCDSNGKIAVKLTAGKHIHLQIINDYAQAADCNLSRVFQRFYRADKARTPDGSYGLGLSIAKSIIELHRGKIQARALGYDRLLFEVFLNPQSTFKPV